MEPTAPRQLKSFRKDGSTSHQRIPYQWGSETHVTENEMEAAAAEGVVKMESCLYWHHHSQRYPPVPAEDMWWEENPTRRSKNLPIVEIAYLTLLAAFLSLFLGLPGCLLTAKWKQDEVTGSEAEKNAALPVSTSWFHYAVSKETGRQQEWQAVCNLHNEGMEWEDFELWIIETADDGGCWYCNLGAPWSFTGFAYKCTAEVCSGKDCTWKQILVNSVGLDSEKTWTGPRINVNEL